MTEDQPSAATILEDMAATYRERSVYDSPHKRGYELTGDVLSLLARHGSLLPEVLVSTRGYLFMQLVNKVCRLAQTNLDHRDSAHDAGVYAAMIEDTICREREAALDQCVRAEYHP